MSIQVKNIHKQFGDFVALDNISLDFPSGELVALLGPSGCGKTTLLRMIAGLDTPDSGQIILDGEDASQTHVRERQVGFVFQHYALFRHMNVFDNIAFGMRMKPKSMRPSKAQIEQKVHELLRLVQLDWLADRLPTQLSGGQRQRIALARALAVEPRVLLLDEPFGALDAKVRKDLRRWLRRLHDELHITSIFVTHDQEEALEVADRIVLMNAGHVEQIGTAEEVYRHPATPFVYGFLGSVNLFHGRVTGEHVQVGEHRLPNTAELEQNASVIAFARPHELDILANTQKADGVRAQITRILSFNAHSKIELSGIQNGQSDPTQFFEVHTSPERIAEQQLHEGQIVLLVPSRLSVFEQGAGI